MQICMLSQHKWVFYTEDLALAEDIYRFKEGYLNYNFCYNSGFPKK